MMILIPLLIIFIAYKLILKPKKLLLYVLVDNYGRVLYTSNRYEDCQIFRNNNNFNYVTHVIQLSGTYYSGFTSFTPRDQDNAAGS